MSYFATEKDKHCTNICPSLSLSADVCNSTDLPELEIISLLEEQLPVYKLRADTIFAYEQDDWLHTPLVEPDAALDLTTEQIEETLKYFCKFNVYCCLRWVSVEVSVSSFLINVMVIVEEFLISNTEIKWC